ncbi:MAG: type IX secretion system protein PorQ [Bacteroidetes bacterium]|nr:type IX secretion system protein PorQ [Bacteroidota bacterium]
MAKISLLIIFSVLVNISYAQLGGSYSFAFMKLPNSARVAALGGTLNSTIDQDVNQGFQNPALINGSMSKQISLNNTNYFKDISINDIAYAHQFKKTGTWLIGIHAINYGDIKSYDENAILQGNVKAAEQCFYVGYGYQFNKNIIFGTNVKFLASSFGNYISNAVAVDFGSSYRSNDSLFTASFVMKNMGSQIQRYYSGSASEPLPYEFQTGISFKPKHMPIRFSFAGTNLQSKNTTFINPNKPKKFDLDSGIEIPQTISTTAKILSHLTVGAEFIIMKKFYLQIGYNFRTRRDMVLEDVKGVTGFSWGFGLRLKRLSFNYGSAQYHMGQTTNHFSVAFNLNGAKFNLFKKVR